MVSEINWFYVKPDVTTSWFLRQGRCTQLFDCRFWKGDADFIWVFHCKYTSIMHRLRFNELFMFARNDIIAIWSLEGASGNFWLRILFNWYFLSILSGLDVIRLFLLTGISLLGAKCWGHWGKMMTPKRQMREKHLLGGHFLTPNCVFWAIVRKIISIRLACAGAQ